MPKTVPEETRQNVEARLAKAQKTTDDASAIIQAELEAARAKTARLREERLAKEAREAASELNRKPRRKKT
jgi:hypothetical protein